MMCASSCNATALRRAFRRWADAVVDDDTAEDLTLAVYEALINITDDGTWQSPDADPGHRGRGLAVLHQLTTHAHVELDSRSTTVCLRHQLGPQRTMRSHPSSAV